MVKKVSPHQNINHSDLTQESTGQSGAYKKLIDRFLSQMTAEQNISNHTFRAYREDLHGFFEFLKKEPEKVDNLDIRDYMTLLYMKGLTKTTIGRKLAAIRS